jgi:hypothetical protein
MGPKVGKGQRHFWPKPGIDIDALSAMSQLKFCKLEPIGLRSFDTNFWLNLNSIGLKCIQLTVLHQIPEFNFVALNRQNTFCWKPTKCQAIPVSRICEFNSILNKLIIYFKLDQYIQEPMAFLALFCGKRHWPMGPIQPNCLRG